MANTNTAIEWTDATWNVVTGCTKVSQGCKHCYAERLFPRVYPGRKFTDIQLHPDRLGQPLAWKKPRRVFVNSMSDLFHEAVPESFLAHVFMVMILAKATGHNHQFQILTKRPERLLTFMNLMDSPAYRESSIVSCAFMKFGPDAECAVANSINRCLDEDRNTGWPPSHVWLGVSCEDQATFDNRVPLLIQVPAAVRFLSLEPLLGPINGEAWFCTGEIHWVVVGGESGPKPRPMQIEWARTIRDDCQDYGIPFFFKQFGEYAPTNVHTSYGIAMAKVGKKAAGRVLDGRTWDEFPHDAEAVGTLRKNRKRRHG